MGSNARMMAALMMAGKENSLELTWTTTPVSNPTDISEWQNYFSLMGTSFGPHITEVSWTYPVSKFKGTFELIGDFIFNDPNVTKIKGFKLLKNATQININSPITEFNSGDLPSTLVVLLLFCQLVDFDGSNIPAPVSAIRFDNNNLNQTSVDSILIKLVQNGLTGGVCYLTGGTNSKPSTTGFANLNVLRNRGWTVYTN